MPILVKLNTFVLTFTIRYDSIWLGMNIDGNKQQQKNRTRKIAHFEA
jgi:hypothetical protein